MSTPLKLGLPTYVQQENQENYNQELNQTLREFLTPFAFQFPSLTAAEVVIVTPFLLAGAQWFNSTLGKMQILNSLGIVETITSV